MDSNEINRLLLNLVRKGTIAAVNHGAELCRVTSGELQTNWIRWITLRAGATVEWNPPTIGEQVLLFCPGGDPADGVALCGLYADSTPAPSHSPDKHARKYPDGAAIEYDHAAHALTATLPEGATVTLVSPGSITVISDSVTIDAPHTHVTGNVTVDGDVVASGVSLVHHVHGGVAPGGAMTGEPAA